jgi:hypothetical protein
MPITSAESKRQLGCGSGCFADATGDAGNNDSGCGAAAITVVVDGVGGDAAITAVVDTIELAPIRLSGCPT